MDKKMESFLDEIIEETKSGKIGLDRPEEAVQVEQVEKMQMSARRTFMHTKRVLWALIGIFAAVLLLCGIYVVGHLVEKAMAEQPQSEPSSTGQGTSLNQTPTTPSTTVPVSQPKILDDLKQLYDRNHDMVGHLNFPYDYLNLKYPVMQTVQDEGFYLDHSFSGEVSNSGCLCVDKDCDVFKPSDNVIIYGNNLKTGGMFNKLLWYQEEEYFQSHQTFQFSTLYEVHTYQIFAVFKTSGVTLTEDGQPWGYPYQSKVNFADEADFNQYIADVKGAAFTGPNAYVGQSIYDTGVTPQYGAKLLTLSTAEYSLKDPEGKTNGRWVVMAYRID